MVSVSILSLKKHHTIAAPFVQQVKNALVIYSFMLTCVLCFPRFTHAQTDSLAWGLEFNLDKKEYLDKIFILNQKHTVAIKLLQNNPSLFTLLQIDNNTMSVVKETTLQTVVFENAQAAYLQMYKLKDKYIMFSNAYNPTKREHFLLAQEINLLTGELGSAKKILTYNVTNEKNLGEFKISVSEDEEQFLVVHHLLGAKEDHLARRRFLFSILDGTLESTWFKAMELPNLYMEAQAVSFNLTNRGNIAVLNAVGNVTSIRRRTFTFTPTLLVIFTQDNQIKDFSLEIKGRRIATIQKLLEDNKIVIAGTFTTSNSLDAKGLYHVVINEEERKVVQKGYQTFTDDELLDFSFDRRNDRLLQIEDLEIYDIFSDGSGGAYLVGEQTFITETTTQDIYSGQIIRTFRYHKNNIAVTHIDKNGQINFLTKVPKAQMALNVNSPHFSYLAVKGKDNIYLLYNDNPKNTAEEVRAEKNTLNATARRMQTNLVTVSKIGKTSAISVADTKETKTTFFTLVSAYCQNQNQLVVFGETNKGFRFGKVTGIL